MEATLNEILKIDKRKWTPVKFGDVAFEPKENAKDIYNEGIEHVVGLEHIDSENIHLTRSGKLEESTTFSKKFKKGDVLFGRRRAYLKKAAVANFDGICSGDITVFRAKKNLLPQLLPFIVHNEKFFDYAVKHSAGGLSPRVKFKDLANYEFLLPPKDQQTQLAELLWAMDEVIEREREVDKRLTMVRLTNIREKVTGGLNPSFIAQKGWKLVRLREIIDSLETGPCVKYLADDLDLKGKCVLKTSAVSYCTFLPYEKYAVVPEDHGKLKVFPKQNSILVSRINTSELVGASAYIDKDYPSLFLPDRIWQCVISKNNVVDVKWLSYMLSSSALRLRISSLCAGTSNSMKYITKEIFLNIEIPLPTLVEQATARGIVERIDELIEAQGFKLTASRALQKALINQIF